MKVTFSTITAGETVGPNGRRSVIKDKPIDVNRLDITAFIPSNPQTPALTELLFWLTNGDTYSMVLSGAAQHNPPVVKEIGEGATNGETVQQGTGQNNRTDEDEGPSRGDNVQHEEGREVV